MTTRSLLLGLFGLVALTASAQASPIGDVFVIAMENHNFTQPAAQTTPSQLLGNAAAPYQNSLITPGNPNAAQSSFASNYQNVAPGVHPSEPNYIWSEAGSNLGVFNDNQPFGTGGTNQSTTKSLSNYLQNAGVSWKSYQEDIDLATNGSGQVTSTVAPKSQWTVPLNNMSGTSTAYTNQYNGSNQYDYAAKHNPQDFFTTTNGGNDTTPSNPLVPHYAPLQQLQTDLADNSVARYNWITPDQFNDSHTALKNGFDYNGVHYTGDQAAIAQGDHFLSLVIPQIEASQAYQNNGAIVIWWDETEGGDDAAHTLEEIVISPLAKGNAYTNNILYTHSSDLLTYQELFGVGPCLGDACNATDLSDLFVPGAVPTGALAAVPEPASLAMLATGFGLVGLRRRRSK